MTQVLRIDPENLELERIIIAAEVLKKGGLVIFPTETVYGVGANFFDEVAIKRLGEIKQRPQDKPFTAHIADFEDLTRFECDISLFAKEVIERFWPGPLTVIFDTKKSGKVGFRLPNSKIARELIRQSNTVVAAASANISGQKPPTEVKEVSDQLKDKVDIILDAGETTLRKESTVVDFTLFPYKIVREGVISREKIAETEFRFWKDKESATIKKILFVCTGNTCRSPMAQGYLKKRLRQIEREDIEVYSRGMSTPIFSGPAKEALEVLKTEAVDISGHRPTPVSDIDIKEADLILVMEESQREEILEKAPMKKERVYLLAEFGIWGGRIQDTPLEIQDPIGQPILIYKEVFKKIKDSIERLVEILI